MANSPKKVQDPTEAALSAIQEALSVRATESPPSEPRTEIPPESSTSEPTLPEPRLRPTSAPAFPAAEDRYESAAAPEDRASPRRAANDDRQSIGQILHS